MKVRLFFAALCLPAAVFARGTPQVLIETRLIEAGPGVLSANFGTNFGNVYANFPSDLRPGDRISGTLAAVPAGRKDAERDANGEALNALSIDVCGSGFTVGGRLFTCPRVSETGSIEIALKFEDRELSRLVLEVPKVTMAPRRSAFLLPTEGLALNRARILGPFGGDASRTEVRIGDVGAHIVVESPRACVFDLPEQPVGVTRIELREGSEKFSGAFRMVGLRLTPPKRIIHTGDTTSFGAEVYGLTGLEKSLSLKLRNLSTDIVSMEGGDEQDVPIEPSRVSSAGTFEISRRLTGTHRGDAVVNVSIPWSEEDFSRTPEASSRK